MSSADMMSLIGTWVLMIPWLTMVVISGAMAFKKWRAVGVSQKNQMFYLWLGAVFVFFGDGIHLIAATIGIFTGDLTGPVNLFGQVFEFRTFAMFFDGSVFMIYYGLWALFIVDRYQQGRFKAYDKIAVTFAALAILLILPGAVPNAMGIYTLDYDIAIWSPHMMLFVALGAMTVGKLIVSAKRALALKPEGYVRTQERALYIMGFCFAFSFVFFILALALIPINPKFAMFMIPKTFVYMTAFVYLIKDVIRPLPAA